MIEMELASEFNVLFAKLPALLSQAPGRVNLLGEHVDYNDGPVLPAAIDRSVKLAVAPRQDNIVNLFALDIQKQISFRLDDLERKVDLEGNKLPTWAIYPAGVAWSFREAGFDVRGLDGVYTSDVPIGAGLSSSAAVQVAFAAAWQELGDWQITRLDLARRCQRSENAYVGVSSGLMDQFASAHGVAGHALYFDTRSLDWEPIPLPAGTALVIADSGVRRSLAGSEYNDRRDSCEQALEGLQKYLPKIRSLRDVSPAEFAANAEFLPEIPRKRAEHVVKEIARVHSAVTALKSGERKAFGALMFAGHASLRDLYEVSIPELDTLVDIARHLPGCFGARLSGAGFGGCTINLVEQEQAQSFINGLQGGYRQRTGREAAVYLCMASDGVKVTDY